MQIQKQQCQIIHASFSLGLSREIQSGGTDLLTLDIFIRMILSVFKHNFYIINMALIFFSIVLQWQDGKEDIRDSDDEEALEGAKASSDGMRGANARLSCWHISLLASS